MTTWNKVETALFPFGLKKAGKEFRCNSPFREGANSHSFTVTVDPDGEHGAYYDHVSGDKGTLYDLAAKLQIETPKAQPIADTKRTYTGLEDYAQAHGVTADVLKTALWYEKVMVYDAEHGKERPALPFETTTGTRYRFIDGEKATYKPKETGYKACWYGLKRAVNIAQEKNIPLALVNGEISTVVCQHYTLPAACCTGGERVNGIPADLLPEFQAAYPTGDVWLIHDCDDTGRKWAAAIAGQLGTRAKILDLGLSEHGDAADFCMLHTTNVYSELEKRVFKPFALLPANIIPVVTRSSQLTAYVEYITNETIVPEIPPIPFPFKALHYLKGEMQYCEAGQLLAIVGASGTGKTSLLESMADGWLDVNVPPIVWSPEWTAKDFLIRSVQRYGGATRSEHQADRMARWEIQQYGKVREGKLMTAAQRTASINAVRHMRQWDTEVGYLDMPLLTPKLLEERLPATIDSLSFKPRVLIIDYVQLLHALDDNDLTMYNLLMRIKGLCAAHKLLGVIATQTTKRDARGVSDGQLLDAQAARWVNDDAFNGFVTINPDLHPDTREFLPSAALNVVKNSNGAKGKVRVPVNWERLLFADQRHPDQSFGSREE